MGLSIHYQLAHFESFSHGRKGCGVTSAFFPKLFYLLTQPAVLYSRAILSYPRLRNCNFSYVFFTSISLWLITRHKLTQKCLPSIFFVLKTERRDFYICLWAKVPQIKGHAYVTKSTRLTDLVKLCDCGKLSCSRSIDKSSCIIFIHLNIHSLLG